MTLLQYLSMLTMTACNQKVCIETYILLKFT